MKKIQLFALFSALTVMGLASCQPAETSPEKQETAKGHSVIFNVQVKPEAETKTALSLEIVPDWRYTDTDDIHIFETNSVDNKILKASDVDIFTEDNDRKAYFHAFFEDIGFIINPSGVLTKAASTTYNYTALMSTAEIEGDNIKFVVPNVQYPNSNATIDPKADFLIGNCATTYNSWIEPDQRLDLKFIRPVAITRFSIFNVDGSKIESIKFTSEDFLTGYTTYDKVDFDDFTAEFSGDEADKTLTMVYPGGKNKSSLFTVYTITLPGEKRIKSIEIRTDTHVLTKSYATPAKLNFVKDMLREVSLDMSTATKTALLDQEMQFKDGNGDPVEEMTYDLVANEGSIDNFVSPKFSRGSECQTTVSFASDNEAVATVDADGNIKLTGAAGVAVITASADGDAAHKAGKATVTITVVTPEVTFYKANAIDADVEYLIVANSKAVKYTATGMGFEDVTVDEGTINIDNSLLEGLLWKAAAISSTSEFITYGTHTFACGDNMLMRESDGNGTMALATSDAAMSKYMAWNYNGTNFWNHSINGENINDFYLTYDTVDGWIFEYQTTPTALLFTTLKPREISFETASYTYDRYTDDNFVAPTIEGATYTSSDPDIAEVDPATGAVTIEGGKTKTGTVTITATVAAGNGFQGASASYSIVVGDANPGISKPVLVYLEPATELVAGEKYYLVSNGMVLARDGADAAAVEFDADKVAAVVDVDLVGNIAWTLVKQTGTITRGNEYVFTQGEYFFGIAMNTNQTTFTYTVEVNDGREVSNNVTIQDHNISLTNNQIYYAGNSSNYYIFYNTTDNKWDNEKVSSSSTPAATSTTALYVAIDTRDEQTAQFVDANSEPVTAVEFDLASGADFVAPTLDGAFYGDVTYSTDDTHGVITLDETTGDITINKKGGPVTITATIAGNESYKPATASYTLTVTNSDITSVTYYKASALEADYDYVIVSNGQALKNNGNGNVVEAEAVTVVDNTITIENPDDLLWHAADADEALSANGKYTFLNGTEYLYRNGGSATSTLIASTTPATPKYGVWNYDGTYLSNISTSNGTSTYYAYYNSGWKIATSNYSSTLLFTTRPTRDLSFSSTTATFDMAEDNVATFECPVLNDSNVTVNYSSSDETIVKVNATTGKLTDVLGVGTVTIKAEAASDNEYQASFASYTLTVFDSSVPTYTRVTSTNDLVVGDQYLLVYEGSSKVFKPFLASTTNFSKSTGNVLSATITNHTISSADFASCHLTLMAGNYFRVDEVGAFIYPGNSSLNAEFTASNALTITFNEGIAQIKNGNYYLVWSTNSNYFSSNTAVSGSYSAGICLYKLQDSRQARSISYTANRAVYDLAEGENGGWTVQLPTLPNESAANVIFTSSDESVATVDEDGNVELVLPATKNTFASITATVAASSEYKLAKTAFTIEVIDSNVPKYYKVDELENGKEYLIVSNGYALSLNGTNVAAEAVTATDNDGVILFDESAATYSPLWTANVSGSTVKVMNGSNYLRTSSYGTSFSISNTDSNNAIVYDPANNTVKVGSYYLNYSGSSFSLNSSATNTSAAFYSATKPMPSLEFDRTSIKYDVANGTWSSAMPVLSPAGAKDKVYVEFDVTEGIIQDVDTEGDTFIVTLVDDLTELVGCTATVTVRVSDQNAGEFKNESASFTVEVIDSSAIPTYTKVSDVTVGGVYLIVSVGDDKVMTGSANGSSASVSPDSNGVITDTNSSLAAYEYTLEKSGDDYYWKYSDGNYLICNYTANEGGNASSGFKYVDSQADVEYPYSLTISNGAFFFKTTRADNNSADQYIYYKTSESVFKIGGSGSSVGVHLYKKN